MGQMEEQLRRTTLGVRTAEPPKAADEQSGRSHKTVPIHYIQKLVDEVGGVGSASDLLGLTPGTITDLIKIGQARPAYEMAAQFCLENAIGKGARLPLPIIVAFKDREQEQMVKTMLKTLGVKFVDLNI